MKQISYCLLLLLAFTQLSFAQSRKEQNEKNTFQYMEGVTFTVLAAQHTRATGGNYNTTLVADKGYSFITLILEFKNDDQADAELEFSNFAIGDKDGNKYSIMGAVQAYKVGNTDQNFTFTLKKGKSKKYILTFKPYPKEDPVSFLLIGSKVLTLTGL
jgi:hypothetical protein